MDTTPPQRPFHLSLPMLIIYVAAFAALGAALILRAPSSMHRYLALYILASLALNAAVVIWTRSFMRLVLNRTDRFVQEVGAANQRVEESMTQVAGIIDGLRANAATAAAGQQALDQIRNIWGEEADRWFDRSSLN